MCRHLAYLGPPITLHELLYAPPYGLLNQASAPREQRHGRVNADGFGVGWYHPGRSSPVRYRRAMPIWADVSFADVARVVRSSGVLAAVRNGTPGFPVDESCAQPFTGDDRLFSHNGAIDDFAAVAEQLRRLGDSDLPDARAPLDSASLFAQAVRLARDGLPLDRTLAAVVERVRGIAPGRYNLLATDGVRIAATACGDSLYTRLGDDFVIVASEPFDDEPGWRAVPEGSVVSADLAGVRVHPIEELSCTNPPSTTS